MKHGIDLPLFEEYSDPHTMAVLAYEAEQAGWDGVFTWDHLWPGSSDPTVDPWVALSAIASRTERIRIGAMVTPVARRRPWQLARTTISLDHLSNGRLTFGAGLGEPAESEFAVFGEETDNRLRAQKLDEGLDVLEGLWSGEEFSYTGEHFRIDGVTFRPTPVQRPRIPVWIGGQWPNQAPFRRAARWDGAFPIVDNGRTPITPDDLRRIGKLIAAHRVDDAPFDMIVSIGNPMSDRSALDERISSMGEAGLTWAIYGFGPWVGTFAECRARIRQGPPR